MTTWHQSRHRYRQNLNGPEVKTSSPTGSSIAFCAITSSSSVLRLRTQRSESQRLIKLTKQQSDDSTALHNMRKQEKSLSKGKCRIYLLWKKNDKNLFYLYYKFHLCCCPLFNHKPSLKILLFLVKKNWTYNIKARLYVFRTMLLLLLLILLLLLLQHKSQ